MSVTKTQAYYGTDLRFLCYRPLADKTIANKNFIRLAPGTVVNFRKCSYAKIKVWLTLKYLREIRAF